MWILKEDPHPRCGMERIEYHVAAPVQRGGFSALTSTGQQGEQGGESKWNDILWENCRQNFINCWWRRLSQQRVKGFFFFFFFNNAQLPAPRKGPQGGAQVNRKCCIAGQRFGRGWLTFLSGWSAATSGRKLPSVNYHTLSVTVQIIQKRSFCVSSLL